MDGLQAPQVRTLIRWLKDGPPGAIPISSQQHSLGCLQAITWEDAGDLRALDQLEQWHKITFAAFAMPVQVTAATIRRWLVAQVLEVPDRVLFWVRNPHGQAVGHVGLSRFDFIERTVALRDVVCGEPGAEPLVAEAVETLRRWAREIFQLSASDPLPLVA